MVRDGAVAHETPVALALHHAECLQSRHLVLQRTAGHPRHPLQSAEVERLVRVQYEVDDHRRQGA
jgi:hypothetical protein